MEVSGGEGEEEEEGVREEEGTVDRARSRLSMLSTRSLAKRVIAKSLADCVSRLVRSWRLRKSATERRYLSCGGWGVSLRGLWEGVVVDARVWRGGGVRTFRSMTSAFLASSSFLMGSSSSSLASLGASSVADGSPSGLAFASAVVE